MDPLLAQHLAFFGIDFSSLQKVSMSLDHVVSCVGKFIFKHKLEKQKLFLVARGLWIIDLNIFMFAVEGIGN